MYHGITTVKLIFDPIKYWSNSINKIKKENLDKFPGGTENFSKGKRARQILWIYDRIR